MHYKDGSEAREGDPVVCRPDAGFDYTIAGKLHTIRSNSETCNGQVAVPIVGGVNQVYVTIKDCYHAGQAYAAADEIERAKAATKTT